MDVLAGMDWTSLGFIRPSLDHSQTSSNFMAAFISNNIPMFFLLFEYAGNAHKCKLFV